MDDLPIQPVNIQSIIDAIPTKLAGIALFIILVLRFGKPIEAFKNVMKVFKNQSAIEMAIEQSKTQCQEKIQSLEDHIAELKSEVDACLQSNNKREAALESIYSLSKEIEKSKEEMPAQLISKFFKALSHLNDK